MPACFPIARRTLLGSMAAGLHPGALLPALANAEGALLALAAAVAFLAPNSNALAHALRSRRPSGLAAAAAAGAGAGAALLAGLAAPAPAPFLYFNF